MKKEELNFIINISKFIYKFSNSNFKNNISFSICFEEVFKTPFRNIFKIIDKPSPGVYHYQSTEFPNIELHENLNSFHIIYNQ